MTGRERRLTSFHLKIFSDGDRRILHEIMSARRDIREFDPQSDVDDSTLTRLLAAAHLAPSVGFSQPWRFLVVRDEKRRARIRESFLRCREAESARYPEARRAQYLAYRLEGIVEAPLNLCVMVDLRNEGEHVLGTTAQPEAVRASVVCSVQNLWLAARVEGVGVGWVSIIEPEVLRSELQLPPGVEAVAYLCLGRPKLPFADRPLLEETRWRSRRPLADLVHYEQWSDPLPIAPSRAPAISTGEAPVMNDRSDDAAVLLPALLSAAGDQCRAHWDTLAAPRSALGALERMAIQLAETRGTFPVLREGQSLKTCVAIFVADHGVTAEGVSAYPSSVTATMVATIARGRATVNALARMAGAELRLVDVGLRGGEDGFPTNPEVPIVRARVRAGTENLRNGPAMTLADARAAFEIGKSTASELSSFDALGVGEVGIGNTTSAAALVCALTGREPEDVVGRGTGLGDAAVARKVNVVRHALRRVGHLEPFALLSEVGGLELAALSGFMIGAASLRRLVVLDGFLTCAAALVARAIQPSITGYLVASHLPTERGAALALETLGLTPTLSLGLGVGEGTGAALGLGLLRSALEIERSVATFATSMRSASDSPRRPHR